MCLALAACKKDSSEDDSSGTDDSTPTDDSATNDDSGTCTLSVVDTAPAKGEDAWLYRDPLRVTFDEPGESATFGLVDSTGNPVALTPIWDDGSTSVTLDAALAGSTSYTFTVTACGVVTAVDFTTSVYGSPLTIDPAALVGRTYLFDLATAEYAKPPGIGALVALYVSAQVLIGVEAADASTIDLLGGQGAIEGGMYEQDLGVDTFALGADFTAAPFFTANADEIEIVVDNTYTMYDFSIEGTFAPDGSSIGGAQLAMKVDTTNLGDAMNLPGGDDPMAVCDYIEPLGIPCETCPGGKELDNCIAIVAHWNEARTVPVTLVRVPSKK